MAVFAFYNAMLGNTNTGIQQKRIKQLEDENIRLKKISGQSDAEPWDVAGRHPPKDLKLNRRRELVCGIASMYSLVYSSFIRSPFDY